MEKYEIEAQHPDDFISQFLDIASGIIYDFIFVDEASFRRFSADSFDALLKTYHKYKD